MCMRARGNVRLALLAGTKNTPGSDYENVYPHFMTNIKIGDLASELASLLGRVSGEWACSETSPHPLADLPNDRVGLDKVEGTLTAWVVSSDQRRRVEIRCTSETPLQPMTCF